MAVLNADMEREAADVLNPRPSDAVLDVGCGPGVGLKLLAERLSSGWVAGIDPSGAMVDAAKKRNRAAIGAVRVRMEQCFARELPWPQATFDGAIAVNSVMLWEPLEASVAEVARVLRPGGRLVLLTHGWAFKRHGGYDAWLGPARSCFRDSGFVVVREWGGRARSGRKVGMLLRSDGHDQA